MTRYLPPHLQSLARAALVGTAVPAMCVAVNLSLLPAGSSNSTLPLMAALVVEVGILGVLCGFLLQPPWLRWIIYGWVWLLLDGSAIPFLSHADDWNSTDQLAFSLLSAQLGLVTVWAILGRTRWSIRWPLSLVIITGLFTPLAWVDRSIRSEFTLLFLEQFVFLAVLCGMLGKWGYRLVLAVPSAQRHSRQATSASLGETQFGLRDAMLWTTALAICLSVGRGLSASGLSLPWIPEVLNLQRGPWRIGVPPTLFAASMNALMMLLALWAALGDGRIVRRGFLLALVAFAVGFANAIVDFSVLSTHWSAPVGVPKPFWEPEWRGLFYSYELVRIASSCLTGGLHFAALLSLRSFGYRLGPDSGVGPGTR